MRLATVTAAEAWGMAAAICTVLALVLGGVWKTTRLVAQLLVAIHAAKAELEDLGKRMGRVERAVYQNGVRR